METATIEERVAELEKKNQDLEERVQKLEVGQFDTITAEKFLIQSPDGDIGLVLACMEGNPILALIDSDGQFRLALSLSDSGNPKVSLRGQSGETRMRLDVDELRDGPTVALADGTETPVLDLYTIDGGAAVDLNNENAEAVVSLSAYESKGQLFFNDPDTGHPRAAIFMEDEIVHFSLADSGPDRLVAELQNGAPVFFITDRNGDPIRGLKEDSVMGL